MVSERNYTLDILKALGLLLIIVAHTSISKESIVFSLRNFDVVLMVFASGALFSLSVVKKDDSFKQYIKKRFLRLVVPVWIFLFFYFLLIAVATNVLNIESPFDLGKIIRMFFLVDKSYVWIIRVFLIIGLVSIPLRKLKYRLGGKVFVLMLVLLFFMSNLSYLEFQNILVGSIWHFIFIDLMFNDFILYAIGYGFVFGVGMTIIDLREKEYNKMIISFGVMFLAIFLYLINSGYSLLIQLYKYPPQLYYVLYGLLVSLILYKILQKVILNKNFSGIIVFLSKSTLWIYLWHILIVSVLAVVKVDFYWVFEFLIITVFSVLITYFQGKLMLKLSLIYPDIFKKEIVKYFI